LPTLYPDSCSPQAWSASAVIQLIQAMVGLYPFAPANLLALVRPRLPAWLEELTLRNVRVGEEVFVSLRRRYEEARLAEVSVTPDVRLLDAAKVPEKPLFNRTPLVVALALMGSLIGGICLAVLLEIVDPKVRYATQIARDLGVPVLGTVPHVPPQKNTEVKDVAPVIEAL
jgi:hypothetical protein